MMKIIITGGAYSGKTSLIDALSKQGYKTISESAIEIISDLNSKYGVDGQKKWRVENFAEFIVQVGERQTLKESTIDSSKKETIFLDMGLYDCIAYCELMNITPPIKLLDMAKASKYDFVFLFDTLAEFDHRKDTGRISDKARSLKARELIEKTYKCYGFKVIHVKEMSVDERIDFIKNNINLP